MYLVLKHLYSFLLFVCLLEWGRGKERERSATVLEIYDTRQNENVQLTDTGSMSLSLFLIVTVAERKPGEKICAKNQDCCKIPRMKDCFHQEIHSS